MIWFAVRVVKALPLEDRYAAVSAFAIAASVVARGWFSRPAATLRAEVSRAEPLDFPPRLAPINANDACRKTDRRSSHARSPEPAPLSCTFRALGASG